MNIYLKKREKEIENQKASNKQIEGKISDINIAYDLVSKAHRRIQDLLTKKAVKEKKDTTFIDAFKS